MSVKSLIYTAVFEVGLSRQFGSAQVFQFGDSGDQTSDGTIAVGKPREVLSHGMSQKITIEQMI